ncbi:MAG: hypothetical protein E2O65_14135 [Gammaproteobacteria bacterium]|nr:MAG: hypothetical protein E2O65_14135 [Gammaproteobacteria bacterium]
MPAEQDQLLQATGTRFKLYPQAPVLAAFAEPETVWVSQRPDTIQPGPADDRLYVVEPIDKPRPYEFPYLPPYRGPTRAAVGPGRDGHFDHLEPGDPGFEAAHMYGTVRRVLDIWEAYFGRSIPWHFRDRFERLELIPFVDWDNAQSGYGFIEVGYGEAESGARHPYSLNFDVLAHEFGHSLIFSEVGVPTPATMTAEYRGFQESASDLVALVAVLHFDTVVDRVLRNSNGDLYTLNELNRIGELSETEQIRLACNSLRMSDVADVMTPAEQLSQPELHRLGEPLTGAIFDIFVEVYQELLVDAGLIDAELAALSYGAPEDGAPLASIERRFAAAYRDRHDAFKEVLLRARDYLGALLTNTWMRIPRHLLSFRDVSMALLASDLSLTGGRYRQIIRGSLAWREITLPTMGGRSALFTGRDLASLELGLAVRKSRHLRSLPYRERWRLAMRRERF